MEKKTKTVTKEKPPKVTLYVGKEAPGTTTVVRAAPKKEEPVVNAVFLGEQTFVSAAGVTIALKEFLKQGDWWETKGRSRKATLLTHDAVQRIAREAGLVCKDYKVVTEPTVYNNMQYTVQALIVDKTGNVCEPQWGEANKSNLGGRGKANPANMAQKRSYDRTVLKCLGITGVLSEEEISQDDNKDEQMDELNHDERKAIAPQINQMSLAKTKEDFAILNTNMKRDIAKFNPAQLEFLRKLYKKCYANTVKSF